MEKYRHNTRTPRTVTWHLALYSISVLNKSLGKVVVIHLEYHIPVWRSLIFKRVDPYLSSALAPVLECSGSRRLYPRKGTSVDRVSVVFVARVDRRILYYSSKTDSWWEHVR